MVDIPVDNSFPVVVEGSRLVGSRLAGDSLVEGDSRLVDIPLVGADSSLGRVGGSRRDRRLGGWRGGRRGVVRPVGGRGVRYLRGWWGGR